MFAMRMRRSTLCVRRSRSSSTSNSNSNSRSSTCTSFSSTSPRYAGPWLRSTATVWSPSRSSTSSSSSSSLFSTTTLTGKEGSTTTTTIRRTFAAVSSSAPDRHRVRWLNLDDAGLSMLERLSLEEALLKHTHDDWILVGRHHVWPNDYLPHLNTNTNKSTTITTTDTIPKHKTLPEYIRNTTENNNNNAEEDGENKNTSKNTTTPGIPNPTGMIVMGIGGKPAQLLQLPTVVDEHLLVVKRFSGGGTVLMDHQAIWTTLISGRRRRRPRQQEQDAESGGATAAAAAVFCQPYPRAIMEWTANSIFGPMFDKMNAKLITQQQQEQQPPPPLQKWVGPTPTFSLEEDDYVLNGTQKIGGNAQAITKEGWLHHTSFLWQFNAEKMERYLQLPTKRPAYRNDRPHTHFLLPLQDVYGTTTTTTNTNESIGRESKLDCQIFLDAMKEACVDYFTTVGAKQGETQKEKEVKQQHGSPPHTTVVFEDTDWSTVHREVFGTNTTEDEEEDTTHSFETWWLKNRTKILHDLE